MKKIVNLIFIVLIILCMMGTVYALSCSVSMQTAQTEYNNGEEFVVSVNLSNIVSDAGVIAFGATLEYDTDNLTLVKMEGVNGWSSPSYNSANGKLVMDRNEPTTENETIMQITFKVTGSSKKDVSIALKSMSAADGDAYYEIADISKQITINPNTQSSDPTNETNETNETNSNNEGNTNNSNLSTGTNTNTNSVTDVTAQSPLPNTGTKTDMFVILMLVILIMVVIISFIKIRKVYQKKDI